MPNPEQSTTPEEVDPLLHDACITLLSTATKTAYVVAHPNDREDVASMAVLRFLEHQSRDTPYDIEKTNLPALANRITRNVSAEVYRYRQRRPEAPLHQFIIDDDSFKSGNTEVPFDYNSDIITRFLRTKNNRTVDFALLYVDVFTADLDHNEIAEKYGIPEATVRSRIKRMLDHIRKNPDILEQLLN